MQNKLIMGYGEQMDTFLVLEEIKRKDLQILRVFYNEDKCRKYIKEENRKRGQSLFFNR